MRNNCFIGVTPIELETEPCNGEYTSTSCIFHPSVLTYLNLPANSSMTDIITNLILALQYKDEQLQNLQTQIDNI